MIRALAGCLMAVSIGFSQTSAAAADFTAAIKKLKSAIEFEVESKQLPALSIALVAEDQQVWADGFGFQDAERSIKATAETVSRRNFTATLVSRATSTHDGK